MTEPNLKLLKVNPSPFTSRPNQNGVGGKIRIEAPEFTHLDPDSDIPHLASIIIEYVPRQSVIDAESFGHYLRTFRDFVAKPEQSIARLCADIAEVCEPYQLQISTRWSPRAGVAANPTAIWTHPDLRKQTSSILTPTGRQLQ